jgi:hypothetical protein
MVMLAHLENDSPAVRTPLGRLNIRVLVKDRGRRATVRVRRKDAELPIRERNSLVVRTPGWRERVIRA